MYNYVLLIILWGKIMNTDQFIDQFNSANAVDEPFPKSALQKAADWCSDHPSIVKAIEISGMVFGAASLILFPAIFRVTKLGAIAFALVGSLTAVVCYAAYKILDIAVPPHHFMENHVFTPGVYGAGKLYYQGDVPILELQSDDPYEAGVAHGYLMGAPLDDLLQRLAMIKRFARMPHAGQTPETLKAIREMLEPDHVREMEGMVDGFNQWAQENKWFKHTVTVEDLILFHLMPDSIHFSPKEMEAELGGVQDDEAESPGLLDHVLNVLGCTVVIDQDQEEGMVFGRNMDWPSFGVFGTYTLIINRKYSDQKYSTAEIGVPGFVGTLTGMNKHGLSLAMNVCPGNTKSIRGVPAAFFNRSRLESCQSVKEVEENNEKEAPLGSYHLSAADAQGVAKSFHFYQGSDEEEHVVREWKVGKPLITTNCQYTLDERTVAPMHCSTEREKVIKRLFNEAEAEVLDDNLERGKLVEASLSLPFVNNDITAHTVVMYPASKKMKVAFDNIFSGSVKRHDVDLEPLFA